MIDYDYTFGFGGLRIQIKNKNPGDVIEDPIMLVWNTDIPNSKIVYITDWDTIRAFKYLVEEANIYYENHPAVNRKVQEDLGDQGERNGTDGHGEGDSCCEGADQADGGSNDGTDNGGDSDSGKDWSPSVRFRDIAEKIQYLRNLHPGERYG